MRKVLFVTGSRGEYGYIRPLLKRMCRSRDLKPYVVATNMHLLPEFGSSLQEFKRDGIKVDESLLMALAGYTRESMAKSLGILLSSLVDVISREKPDLVLLAGDRGEQLMAAIAASYTHTPVLHIQAGEVSGNVDGMARHAITKFAHIHFAANSDAAERLRRMGEEEFRIRLVGAPQLDEILSAPRPSRREVRARYGVDGRRPFVLLLQHPVTEQMHSAGQQMQATMEAVLELGYDAVVIYPNNDAGSIPVQRAIESVRSSRLRVERNLPRDVFIGLLAAVDAMVGNSSSGILEAPSFELPAVNIGRRQAGRLQGANIINASVEKGAIKEALKRAVNPEFRASLKGKPNPYGDGRSTERILKIIREIPIDDRLLIKRITY